MARVVTMASNPSQDRPDGGPRQYTAISRALFTWLTIRRVFDLSYIQTFGSITTMLAATLRCLDSQAVRHTGTHSTYCMSTIPNLRNS